MTGRVRLTYPAAEVTDENILNVLQAVAPYHVHNAAEIDYLWRYYKGEQPIRNRTKVIRPEINNRIVANHAQEIVDFFSGYFLGEPIAYVRRGSADDAYEVSALNDYMTSLSKATLDKELATWMYVGGVGYRMCLPDADVIEMDTLDPRETFVVYSTDFGRKPLLGAMTKVMPDGKIVIAGYTRTHYFEVDTNISAPVDYLSALVNVPPLGTASLRRYEPHNMGAIPIIEYNSNMALMGAFEPVLDALDAINTVTSNRVDGIEQFIQSIMVLYNADIDEEAVTKMRSWGLVKLKSTDSMKADLKILSEQLDQTQTQTLVDDMLARVKEIVGMPNNAKGLGGGASGNVGSVIMWQGWETCEARVRDTELLFKRSERQFLRLVLSFLRMKQIVDLSETSIEIKFVRRQYDAAITKVQSLQGMLSAGIEPEIAIAACGLFNDPVDVAERSKPYMEKWRARQEVNVGGDGGNEPPAGYSGSAGEAAGSGGDRGDQEGRT